MDQIAREAFYGVWDGKYEAKVQAALQEQAARAQAQAQARYALSTAAKSAAVAQANARAQAEAAAAAKSTQSNWGFAGDIVKGAWSAAGQAVIGTNPLYMGYNGTKLLVTEPGQFFHQYVDAWDTASGVAGAWWDAAGSTVDVLQGDKSISDHVSDALHSSLFAHIGESWDNRDGEAVGSTWINFVGIVAGLKGVKPSIKPTRVAPKPVLPEVVVPAKLATSEAKATTGATTANTALAADARISGMVASVDSQALNYTRTVIQNTGTRPYIGSPMVVDEIMAGATPRLDPGGVATALRWDAPGAFNGTAGTYELVIDTSTNTVLHFLFKAG